MNAHQMNTQLPTSALLTLLNEYFDCNGLPVHDLIRDSLGQDCLDEVIANNIKISEQNDFAIWTKSYSYAFSLSTACMGFY